MRPLLKSGRLTAVSAVAALAAALLLCGACGIELAGLGAVSGGDSGVAPAPTGNDDSGNGMTTPPGDDSGPVTGAGMDGGPRRDGALGLTDANPVLPKDAGKPDATGGDAGPSGDAGNLCPRLTVCCQRLRTLQAQGVNLSPTTIPSCDQAAQSNNSSNCASLLSLFASLSLCM